LRLPPGLAGGAPAGEEGAVPRPAPSAPSIASSLRSIERRMYADGAKGVPTGTGKQMGPLFFDPEGADFTLWVNHFKNEVYRNWIVPQPALLGIRGHVDLEFSVERDGRLTNLRMLKSSGTSALDRAAQNALVGSRLLPLPADYGPPRVQMQVTFFYNEGPQGS
jgi:TonB family protein